MSAMREGHAIKLYRNEKYTVRLCHNFNVIIQSSPAHRPNLSSPLALSLNIALYLLQYY